MVGALIKYPFAMTDRKFYYDCRSRLNNIQTLSIKLMFHRSLVFITSIAHTFTDVTYSYSHSLFCCINV